MLFAQPCAGNAAGRERGTRCTSGSSADRRETSVANVSIGLCHEQAPAGGSSRRCDVRTILLMWPATNDPHVRCVAENPRKTVSMTYPMHGLGVWQWSWSLSWETCSKVAAGAAAAAVAGSPDAPAAAAPGSAVDAPRPRLLHLHCKTPPSRLKVPHMSNMIGNTLFGNVKEASSRKVRCVGLCGVYLVVRSSFEFLVAQGGDVVLWS